VELAQLHRISPARLEALRHSGIEQIADLLYSFPRRYIDRSAIMQISSLHAQTEPVTVIGKITGIKEAGFGRKKRLVVSVFDGSGVLDAVFFKGLTYFKKRLKAGKTISLFGIPKRFGGVANMTHPEIEDIDEDDKGGRGIVPVYPSTAFMKGTFITNSVLQGWVRQILESKNYEEYLPEYLLAMLGVPERMSALRYIHLPDTLAEPAAGVKRFKTEELLLFQLSMQRLRADRVKKNPGLLLKKGNLTRQFLNDILPFRLTEGQSLALRVISEDFQSAQQMNRLLQGDVGSGKTVVAIASMLMGLDSGYQAAMMAPTEILAEQHYHTLNNYLSPLGINIRLLTGNQAAALRRDILSDIAGGSAHIVVGTHALIQDQVKFFKLGVTIIDEQHRFGVLQRSNLLAKGHHPHVLVMSATPIPRSLALTLYSDLDVSIIKGLPAGRQPIVTALKYDSNRSEVYQFLEDQVDSGGQVYVVYPLVEESESMDLKDATMGFDQLSSRFSRYHVGLIHGRMRSEEKERVMKAFSEGDIQILVSTTVIEVGVNVPNASVMVVEHAERFGLSQLHQLRGRIGRGSRKSYCILMSDVKRSKDARVRLETMVRTSDGFEIAEVDLKLRGPGDFLGTKQSGLPDFRFADIVEDQQMVQDMRDLARAILSEDPGLVLPKNLGLRRVFERYFKSKARYFSMG
jgi:ATP-dependent DNA helicase RecG